MDRNRWTIPWSHSVDSLRLVVLLFTLAVPMTACSVNKSAEAWTAEYQRHANLVKATATGQQELLELKGTASCLLPGVVLWPYLSGPWITQVNPEIVAADVQAGDRVVAVNGKYVKHLGILLLRLSRLRKDARLELALERNHEIHRVKVKCADSTPVFKATAGILEAAAAGDWQQCLRLATDLSSITQIRYSWAAELEYNCNEAGRLLEQRPASALDASLAHQWARLRIKEANEVPEGIDQVRWPVTDMIFWLKRHGFTHLAIDLSDHLDAYSPHLW